MIELRQLNPPTRHKSIVHIGADFVELLCLHAEYKEVSKEDALMTFFQSLEMESETEAEGTIELDPSEELNEMLQFDDPSMTPKFKDFQEQRATDWFEQLQYRKKAFRDYYPFIIEEDTVTLQPEMTVKRKLYLFLLLCSNLSLFRKKTENILTTRFELLCAEVLKKYLPDFNIDHFGKIPIARKKYPNKFIDAVKKLTQNLCEYEASTLPECSIEHTGDGGLDIVGWKSFPFDRNPGKLVCFAQCACSYEDWKKKQFESSMSSWQNRIHFYHPPANIMFIPYCYRRSTGDWESLDQICTILFDRLRICFLLDPGDFDNFHFNLFEPVDEFLHLVAS